MNNKEQKVFEMMNMTKMAADGSMREKEISVTAVLLSSQIKKPD